MTNLYIDCNLKDRQVHVIKTPRLGFYLLKLCTMPYIILPENISPGYLKIFLKIINLVIKITKANLPRLLYYNSVKTFFKLIILSGFLENYILN